jgi:hypothetical protein
VSATKTLPDPCSRCAPFGGAWMETEAGLKRCDCSRGVALTAQAETPVYRAPVLSTEQTTIYTEMMAGIPFFPPEAGARSLISHELACICESAEQARWLAIRMVRLYRKWPGLIELRTVFCSKYHPLDALPALGASEVYPDGIPSERGPAPEPKRLFGKPEPGQISAAASIENTVRDLVELKDMNRAGVPPRRVRDIPLRQLKPDEQITPEMIREAEEEYRAEKARQELALQPDSDVGKESVT